MKINFKPGHVLGNLWRHYSSPAVFCLIAFVTYSISSYLPYGSDNALWKIFDRIGSASMVGLVFSTSICTMRGRIKAVTPISWCAGIAGAVLYWMNISESLLAGLVLALLALCLYFASGKLAPAIRMNQICGWFFTCLGLSIVVSCALSIVQSAVTSLFFGDLHYSISSDISDTVMYFSFLIFAPWIFLGGLPDEDTASDKRLGFRTFNARVLLPLSLALMAVLLAYVCKIVLTWTMPVGTMNSFALAALTLFTFFHLTLMGEENRISAWFIKWGGWMMLPVLLAQQVGVWIRVEAYGLTEARIYGMALTLLCAGVVMTALFHKRANWFFPAAAVLMLLFISSPVNAATLARLDQESRLEAALTRNNMIAGDGSIIPNADAAVDDRRIIYDSAEYLDGIEAPVGSLTHQLQSQLTDKNGNVQTWDKDFKYTLFGFVDPSTVSGSFHWDFKGSATHGEVNTKGYDYAEWFSKSLYSSDSGSFDSYLSFDTSELYHQLLRTETPFIFPDMSVLVTLNGETLDLRPLLSDVVETTVVHETSERTFDLVNDEATLPSGRILRITSISVYYSSYSESTSLSLTGWILTPEGMIE